VSPLEYDGRRPRLPAELAARIDAERGQVPFERWVRGALEQALSGSPVVAASSPERAPQDGSGRSAQVERSREAASPRAHEPERVPEVGLPKIAKRKW
jgi:hypothetical protein